MGYRYMTQEQNKIFTSVHTPLLTICTHLKITSFGDWDNFTIWSEYQKYILGLTS